MFFKVAEDWVCRPVTEIKWALVFWQYCDVFWAYFARFDDAGVFGYSADHFLCSVLETGCEHGRQFIVVDLHD